MGVPAASRRWLALLPAAVFVALMAFATAFAGAGAAAPAGACQGADDANAPLVAQQRAVTCLVNVARRQAGRSPLATPWKLKEAAAIKGRRVVSCAQFTHTPCGSSVTAAIKASGYRFSWFGENLFAGTWAHYSPRQVVDSWLASPGHRANILRPAFRHLGTSRIRAQGVFGEAETAIWVATFASPKRR
jgi:uncharacterized protein YkwD